MNLLQSYNTTAKINTIQNASVRDLLGRLLSHYPDQRIGSDENPDIRSHPFFDSTDWHQIRVAILPLLRSKVTHFFYSKQLIVVVSLRPDTFPFYGRTDNHYNTGL